MLKLYTQIALCALITTCFAGLQAQKPSCPHPLFLHVWYTFKGGRTKGMTMNVNQGEPFTKQDVQELLDNSKQTIKKASAGIELLLQANVEPNQLACTGTCDEQELTAFVASVNRVLANKL